jgi:hypothetical protein
MEKIKIMDIIMKYRENEDNFIDNINKPRWKNELNKVHNENIYGSYLICLYIVFGLISIFALYLFY